MATYTQISCHIVYGTKNHTGTLDLKRHDELCRYTARVLQNKKCFVHKVGGYTEHLHILAELHPSIALADLVKDIKLAQSKWIKTKKIFPAFDRWPDGYGAFTCSWKDRGRIIHYIENQIEHHRHKHFVKNISRCCSGRGLSLMRGICADDSTPSGSMVCAGSIPRVSVALLPSPAAIHIQSPTGFF